MCLLMAFVCAVFVRRMDVSWVLIAERVELLFMLIPLWIIVFHTVGLYEPRYYLKAPQMSLIAGILINFMITSFVLYFIAPIFPRLAPKTILLIAGVFSWCFLTIWRKITEGVVSPSSYLGKVIYLGNGDGDEIQGKTGFVGSPDVQHPKSEKSVSVLDPVARIIEAKPNTMPLPDNTSAASAVVLSSNYLELERHGKLSETLKDTALSGVPIYSNAQFEAMQKGKIPLSWLTPEWFMEGILAPLNKGHYYRVVKRANDLIFGLLLLPFAILIGGLAAVWISIVLKGSAIFKQKRIGKGGKEFIIWKFKTMRDGEQTHLLTQKHDSRVPSSLRWIRKLHLDELPQLINIIKGDMSWVGPRPEQPAMVASMEEEVPYYWLRHMIKPGLTGWAQINMGYVGNIDAAKERFCYELYYLSHISLSLDIAIVARTIKNLISADGR
ncbi:sugar transferase [Elusimicrobiota bacterium]